MPSTERDVELTVELTRVELAGALAAVGAVCDSAPGAPPEPLLTAVSKLEAALKGAEQGG